jgi:hypothetical protein
MFGQYPGNGGVFMGNPMMQGKPGLPRVTKYERLIISIAPRYALQPANDGQRSYATRLLSSAGNDIPS